MVRSVFFKCLSDNRVREAELGLREDPDHVSVISGQGLLPPEHQRDTPRQSLLVGSMAPRPAGPEQPCHFGQAGVEDPVWVLLRQQKDVGEGPEGTTHQLFNPATLRRVLTVSPFCVFIPVSPQATQCTTTALLSSPQAQASCST